MERVDFLNRVIDDGIAEITTEYTRDDQLHKKEGGIKGFEECRGKTDDQLMVMLAEAKEITNELRMDNDGRYWYFVMRERQIEWVINVLSAKNYLKGKPTMVIPTAKGALKAGMILGRFNANGPLTQVA